ncbi:HAD family hydrolase [Thermus brockianus]|uniref:Hydrolase n=1 Tax=Thermus brockianus TaxID=56956 RepID=A0A1J0LTT9_THEBO|nr:HAD family phosphatase [Thermus brockianus]APD09648.1 hydrolase [Thermus brockianus]
MRGALLDRDGVLLLLDEESLYKKALELSTHGAGLEKALAVLAQAMGKILQAVRALKVRTLAEEARFFATLTQKAAKELRLPPERLQGLRYYHFMRKAPGAEALLQHLKAQGLKVGVLSNTLPSLKESLVYHGLDGYIDGFFASCAMGVAKPDPKAFLLALNGLGLSPEETLYLDDDPENVETAQKLGLRAAVYVPHQSVVDS